MGPKKNKGKGGGGGDKQNQPPPPQQQAQQQTEASQPPQRQQQAARGGQQQGRPQQQERHQPQAERKPQGQESQQAPQQQPQAWRQPPLQQQQQPQPQSQTQQGQGRQQQAGGRPQQVQGSQQPLQQAPQQQPPAWRQPPLQQQQQPQSQAQQGPGPQQQAWGRPQQGQGPQQPLQQAPRGRGRGRGEAQQRPPGFEQQRAFPQGPSQGPVQAAVSGVPPAQPPKSAWGKPQTAPVNIPSVANVEVKVQSVQLSQSESTVKKPDQQTGKGDKRGKGKDEQKSKPGGEKPHTAPEPGQASASGQQASAQVAPEPERKIGDGKDSSLNIEDMLVISPRRTINQKDKPGKRIRVETNHLAISFKKQNIIAYRYDVTFEPDRPKYLIRSAWNEFAARFFKGRYPSFDGKKNVYSNGPLPRVQDGSMQETIEVYNKENDRNKEFKITIKYTTAINLSEVFTYVGAQDETGTRLPRDAMQAIDIILRNLPANQLVQSGRLFFSPPPGRIYDLGEGLDMWYGFHQSAILGWKPYLNVDIAHKGFPTPCTLLETLKIVCEWDGNSALQNWQHDLFRKYVKRLKVEYKIPNLPSSKRVYKINDVVGDARSLRFTLDNGQETTVASYYERERNYKLQYPHLPCLWVGSATGPRKIYIATELCKIVEGQVVNGKMSENQTARMVKEAAKGPEIRKDRIMNQIRQAQYNSSPFANEFGISVAGQFEQVEARVLAAPELNYFQNRKEIPRAGVWRASRFEKSASLTDWCIICLDQRTRDDNLFEFEKMLKRCGSDLNMNPSNPIQPPRKLNPRDRNDDLEKVFRDLLAKAVRIVFVVVRDQGDDYARAKKFSELRVGILTQCIKASTVFKKLNQATVNNILLKVNAKLNGVNHILSPMSLPVCLKKPCMVVGADVTHPSPDSTDIPSVAAVAASHNPNAFQYNMIVRLQDPRDEMIRDLENIMKQQLMFFYRQTKFKPEKILFFRDGVSDGQIPQVFNIEFQAIRRACTSLQADYKPPITFVIVQKRHHTRFFPMDRRDCDERDRNFNVPAGTCVDTQIVHPRETDFYLVSHASIQGTARPTKYRIVWDDNNLGEVELQNLTYYLCHLFSRCTRSVSYPAPTYNAHLAAFRGRVYVEGERINLSELAREQNRTNIHQNIKVNAPMHFV